MNGIYYNRHSNSSEKHCYEKWHQPEGDAITYAVNFKKLFPHTIISIPEGVEERDSDYYSLVVVRIVDRVITAEYCLDRSTQPTHAHIEIFEWDWSGNGATEWWFDDQAVCIQSLDSYQSGTGLTASRKRIIAYNHRVRVDSFRRANGLTGALKPGVIKAEFVNGPSFGRGNDTFNCQRANWTGFAVGAIKDPASDGSEIITPVIGDNLDEIIEIMLSGKSPEKTTCKHLASMQAHILAKDKKSLPRYLCTACRMQGVLWREFSGRSRQDTCPYFRRACKSVAEKSDPLPRWYQWEGDNLLATYRRLQDGDYEAFEAVYARRKEGFIRRSVLLLNNRTQEAWMYPYNGFVPRTLDEFQRKYTERRQILGYLASPFGRAHNGGITSVEVAEDIQRGLAQPLWASGDGCKLIDANFSIFEWMGGYVHRKIGSFDLLPLKNNGEADKDCSFSEQKMFQPFFTDEVYFYYLIGRDWSGAFALRRDAREVWRTPESNKFLLLAIPRAVKNLEEDGSV